MENEKCANKSEPATTAMAVSLAAVSTLSLSGCVYNTFQTTDEQVKAGWSEVELPDKPVVL